LKFHSVLAAQSDFSIGESVLTIERMVREAEAAGLKVVGMTDTMSVTGLIDLTTRCQKAGIKPVIGCRLRLVDDHEKRKVKGEKWRQQEWFLTLYVKSEAGLMRIFKMLSIANDEDHFYFNPKLSVKELVPHLKGLTGADLAVLVGGAHSFITHPDAGTVMGQIAAEIGQENVYIGLTPLNIPYYDSLNAIAVQMSQKAGYPLLAARPALYPKGDAIAAEVMSEVIKNGDMGSIWHNAPHYSDAHILSEMEFIREVKEMGVRLTKRRGVADMGLRVREALANTEKLAGEVSFEWKKKAPSLPKMAENEFAELVRLCKLGWKIRFSDKVFGHQPTPQEQADVYKPRLAYELEVLKTLGFSGYFLLTHDVVNFAKTNGILVGPGRGSVGGSLVAYLVGITDCDPIRFDLMFERFINPSRIDLPDADLDFMSVRRHEVVEYLTSKYGKERVAGITNFSTLGAASAIRDVSRIFKLSEVEYRCSKFVPKKNGQPVSLEEAADTVPEIGTFRSQQAALWPVMEQLEGVIRNLGQHAAGLVVAGCDLTERAVIENRKGSAVVNFDKRTVEDQGLIKLDLLGLATLDLIDLALQYCRQRHSKKIDLMRIDLEDRKVLDNFAQGLTNGVFQYESGGMKKLLRELGEDGTLSFDNLAAASALYRPGPMESGMMDSFSKRKRGIESVEYPHAVTEEILKPTFGTMVYQEQVMKISQVVAGYTGAEADTLRKIMGKKEPDKMALQRDKFVDGAVAKLGVDRGWAEDLFDDIAKFAGYGFNRSHSVEYALISFQVMWLKTHYPVEFFAAALTLMKEDNLPGLLRDAAKLGITVDMPDVNHSTERFEIVTDTRLVIPFTRIKGIGERTAVAIVQERKANGPFRSKADFEARVRGRNCNVGHMTKLDTVGAFATIEPSQKPTTHPDRIKEQRDLIPGLVSAIVPVNHEMHKDKASKVKIIELCKDWQANHGPNGDGDGFPVKTVIGKTMRFMVVTDAPTNGEERDGMLTSGQSFMSIQTALDEAGLGRRDAYWTALIKRTKKGKQITPDEIQRYEPYLAQELEILKPPVIVLLGSTAVRHFIPDFKGKASDSAGEVVYCEGLDANFVIGFSPGEIYHAPEKQEDLNRVFARVAEIL
jgi:DNA polymerase III subunit alpha